MEADYEEENEGKINAPKIMNISRQSLFDKKSKLDGCERKFFSSKSVNPFFSDNGCFEDEKLNNTVIIDKSKFFLKNDDNNSTTSQSSMNDKIKKVTFSTVEIIRVKNYKRYNKINTAKKNEEEENNKSNPYYGCVLF